ncbi:MAG: TraR/DksA C4-type zinc finger protein [Chloroflexi bacterium]|nr:TraR/DksA C4-type zinc finger protein [Chloroflexota bacterium]
MMLLTLDELLARTAALHNHLCPRQVLGVRMGMLAADVLKLDLPQSDKRLFTFLETDGCFADGVAVATGCWLGHRTIRLMDFGKVAATFVDTQSNQAIRVWAHPESRRYAAEAEPTARSHWHAQLAAYQTLPANKLLCWQPIQLTISMEAIISRPGIRVNCTYCGEEILNEREKIVNGEPVCRACAGEAYYHIDGLESLTLDNESSFSPDSVYGSLAGMSGLEMAASSES